LGLGGGREDFQTGLAWSLEEECNGTVVGMGTCSDVDFGLVIAAGGDGGVVEETESAVTSYVAGGEPVGAAFFGIDL
jgi:hypothetical protein